MIKFILVLALTFVSLANTCNLESMHMLTKINTKNLKTIVLENEKLIPVKSSQGAEGKFYYTKNNELKYIELNIFSEMGKQIIRIYFKNPENILVQKTNEYYNHTIYGMTPKN